MNWKTNKSTKELLLKTPLLKSLVLRSIAFIVMVMIMTATPLGMKHHHFEMSDITSSHSVSCSWNVCSFLFTGSLIKRFGDRQIMLSELDYT